MPKKSFSEKNRFHNLLEKKAYGKIRQDEFEKQQLRINAHKDLTKRLLKKSFQEKFKIPGNIYERVISVADKILDEFAQNHNATNIMDDFRGLDKHHNDPKCVDKAMKGWRNQNTCKYGKNFFKDMYLNAVKLADEVAKMIFPNQIRHKNLLRDTLISSLHSKISLTTISFKNKHSRPTPLIPKNSAKHGLNVEIANHIDDPNIKNSLSLDIEAYGNYQQKQSESLSRQLDSLVKEDSNTLNNNINNNTNNNINDNINNNTNNNINNNNKCNNYNNYEHNHNYCNDVNNNINKIIGNNISNIIGNNISNIIGSNINNINNIIGNNINNIDNNIKSNINYNNSYNNCNHNYNYPNNNNNNINYSNYNCNRNYNYYNNNSNNYENHESSDDSTYLSQPLGRNSNNHFNNSISPNTQQIDNDNSSLFDVSNFIPVYQYNNNSIIGENFFSEMKSINGDQILSQLQDIEQALRLKQILFSPEQENKCKELIFNLNNFTIPQKHMPSFPF